MVREREPHRSDIKRRGRGSKYKRRRGAGKRPEEGREALTVHSRQTLRGAPKTMKRPNKDIEMKGKGSEEGGKHRK